MSRMPSPPISTANTNSRVERICYQGVLENRITAVIGVQLRLDELARTQEFQKIYRREIEARGLTFPDVERCRRSINHKPSITAYCNDGGIQIFHADFTVNEATAVFAYYKTQDFRKDCVKWEKKHKMKRGRIR